MLYVSITDKIAKPKTYLTFFQPTNLRLFQRSSKNMNNVMMFCIKNKLLTQKPVPKVSLF